MGVLRDPAGRTAPSIQGRDPELTPLAFMLAYVLADLVNEREGCAWPGITHLAAECHVTGKGVKKVIRSLVERGHLSVEAGVGRRAVQRSIVIHLATVSRNLRRNEERRIP